MTNRFMRALTLGVCAAGFATGAFAGADVDPAKDTTTKELDLLKSVAKDKVIFSFDFGVPVSPAMALLGTNESLAGSSALKPYTLQTPGNFGGSKDAQSFAADVAPAWFLLSNDPSLPAAERNNYDNYSDFSRPENIWLRLENRFRIGGALYLGDKAGGDATKAKDSRLAFGVSLSLLDSSDPLATNYIATKGVHHGEQVAVWRDCTDNEFANIDAQFYPKYQGLFNDQKNAFINTYRNPTSALDRLTSTPQDLEHATAVLRPCLADLCGGRDSLTTALSDALAMSNDNTAAKVDAIGKALDDIEGDMDKKIVTGSLKISTDLGVQKAMDACVARANDWARYGSRLDFGGGAVWDGKPGAADGFSKMSGALWVAGHIPVIGPNFTPGDPTPDVKLLRYWMLGGTVRAGFNETVATGNAVTPKFVANTVDAWVGLESYTADLKFAALAGYKDTMAAHAADAAFSNSGFRWQISGSVRLSRALSGLIGTAISRDDVATSGAWINVTYGSAEGTVKTLDDKALMVTLSFSPAPDSFLGEGG